jgi:hypothetical protein
VSSKDTNPKDAIGIRKAPLSTLPFRVLWRVGLAMLEGACKYGRHNYRVAGVRASVYFDAVVSRHLGAWWEGEDIDAESGLNHIDKAIAGLIVLRDSMLQGNWVDDRPPSTMNDMAELNILAGEIIDRHADKNPRHYTIKDTLNAGIQEAQSPGTAAERPAARHRGDTKGKSVRVQRKAVRSRKARAT